MTDKPDMCAALRKWADRLRDENATMAAELAGYADAWKAERARTAELSKALQQSIDSNVDKIMAMTDDQVAALTRLDGSNPEDSARLGKQACELAIAAVRIAEQDEEIARLRVERSENNTRVAEQGDEIARLRALLAPDGYALVPLRLTAAMNRAMQEDDWIWADLLVAADAITIDQYDDVARQS
jgi:hypothetical protein